MSRQPGEHPDELIDAYIRRLVQGQELIHLGDREITPTGQPVEAVPLRRASDDERVDVHNPFHPCLWTLPCWPTVPVDLAHDQALALRWSSSPTAIEGTHGRLGDRRGRGA